MRSTRPPKRGNDNDRALGFEPSDPLEELAVFFARLPGLIRACSSAIRSSKELTAAPLVVGSRPPLPAPQIPGRTPEGGRRFLRETKALDAYGRTRVGGKAGQSVVYTIAAEGLVRYFADLAKAKASTDAAPSSETSIKGIDELITGSGYRLTRGAK